MSCAREPTCDDQMGGRKKALATCGTSITRQRTVTGRCVVAENTSSARASAGACVQAHWQPQPHECRAWSGQCVCPEPEFSTVGTCTMVRLAAIATWHRSTMRTARRRRADEATAGAYHSGVVGPIGVVRTGSHLSRRRVMGGRQSYVSGSAMDLTWVPCTSETTATGRPLLSLGVTLTAW